jgi:hypothetical protein
VLTKQGLTSTLERTLYLFNDILIIAKKEERETKGLGFVSSRTPCVGCGHFSHLCVRACVRMCSYNRPMMQFKCLSSVSAIAVESVESDDRSFRLRCHLTNLSASPQETELVITVDSASHAKKWLVKFEEAIADMKHKWTGGSPSCCHFFDCVSSISLTPHTLTVCTHQSRWKRSLWARSDGCGCTALRLHVVGIRCIFSAALLLHASASACGRSTSVHTLHYIPLIIPHM